MKKKNIIFSVTLLALGALVAFAPFSFAKVCSTAEKVMKCQWTARVEVFLGIGIALLSVLRIFEKSEGFALASDTATFISGLGVLLFPTVIIGVCGSASMHCNAVTKPVLIILGVLILVTVALDFVVRILTKKSGKKS